MPKNDANENRELAATALSVEADHPLQSKDIIKTADLGLSPEKYLAREQVGLSLLGHTLGLAVASNLQMRENLERAATVLVNDIIEEPLPPDTEQANELRGLKIRAASGLAVLAGRNLNLTLELTNLAELKGRVDKNQKQKRIAPQVFVGTNYVQNNGTPPAVVNQPKPTEDIDD